MRGILNFLGVKGIAILIGLGFSFVLLISFIDTLGSEGEAKSAEYALHKEARAANLPSDGPLGRFDNAQLQRGFQVYKEVCAACHSLKYVAFRDLAALGYNELEVRAIAQQWAIETPTINPETGEAATRPSVAADRFPKPFANEVAARAANNNAVPPDLSLITKARVNGEAYLYSLLTGYGQQPDPAIVANYPEFTTPEGLYYNPYFPTVNLAMAPPITADGQVTYADGTTATVDQMSKDVTAFLSWTAEPKMQARKQAGLAVIGFLLIFIALTWGAYKSIWRDIKYQQ